MLRRDAIKFGDILSSDFGVYILSARINDSPERDTETISVPGRNGDIHIDNGRYRNITVPYTCGIVKGADSNLEGFVAAISSQTGYQRLEDTMHPEYYRLGAFRGQVTPKMSRKRDISVFEIQFNCKPQKYLKRGEEQISMSGNGNKLYNPSRFLSKPLIKVNGTATGEIAINGKQATIASNPGYFTIDSELEDAYNSSTGENYNSRLTLSGNEFPVLESGENTIDVASGMTIVVTPRWWTI